MSVRLRIPLVLLLAGCAGACGGDSVGASSPKALLAKLTTALDELDPAGVASCFDPKTAKGERVAELCNKALTVLTRGRELEAAIADKYGESYVVDHVSLPGPALLLRDFRSQLARATLERGEGNDVRLVVEGSPAAHLYSREGTWFLQPAAMPFGGDETMRAQANELLDRLLEHVVKARKLVDSSGPEEEFRAKMAELGQKTRDGCVRVLWTLMNTMRSKKLLPN